MKVPTLFVEALSAADRQLLTDYHQTAKNSRVRNRAHAVLLSANKFSVDQIARIFEVDRDTVSEWIRNWNKLGESGLADEARSGRPPIMTPVEQEKALTTALKNPKFPHRQLSEIAKESGKKISSDTLKRMIKKKDSGGKESS
jgi:transposase